MHLFVARKESSHSLSIPRSLKELTSTLFFSPTHSLTLLHRWQNAGLQAQWIEAWYPDNPNEMAFIVEDDLEVSPLYYTYLKRLVARYYFDPSNFDPRVFGVSFQRQWFVPGG